MTFTPQQLWPPPHLHVILTNPHSHLNEPHVLIVNLTTPGQRADRTVVLGIRDHPWIRHPSVVFYALAKLEKVSEVERRLQAGFRKLDTPMKTSALQKVQAGILQSRRTPREVQSFYRDYLYRKESP